MANSDEVTVNNRRGEPWQLVRVAEGTRLAEQSYVIETADGQSVMDSKQLMQHAVLAVNAMQSVDPVVLEMGFSIDTMRQHVFHLLRQVAVLQVTLADIRKNVFDYFDPASGADALARLAASKFLSEQCQHHKPAEPGICGEPLPERRGAPEQGWAGD